MRQFVSTAFGLVTASVVVFALILAILFSFGTNVRAQGEDSTLRATLEEKRNSYENARDVIGERREEAINKVASTTDEFKKKMAERRASLAGRVKERVHNLFDNVTLRLRALIERFEQISARLESRIDKSKASGMNTIVAESAFAVARTALTSAKVSLGEISGTNLDQIVDANSPIEEFRTLRTAIIGIRENLRQAQSALLETVTALKNAAPTAPLVNEADVETNVEASTNATTTEATN